MDFNHSYIRNTIYSYRIVWLFISTLILQSCGIKITKIYPTDTDKVEVNKVKDVEIISKLDTSVNVISIDSSKITILYKEEKTKQVDYSDRIVLICDSLNGTLELESNYSPYINKVLNFSSVPLRSAYCGATVKYILSTAGVEYPVKNPEWASNNFIDKSKIVYDKGKRYTDEEFKVGYVTGYRLGQTNRINHVGILIAEEDDYLYVFEGNTTNPKNRKEQGFFYKLRKSTITYIRKTEV